jgi:hypothetical protein
MASDIGLVIWGNFRRRFQFSKSTGKNKTLRIAPHFFRNPPAVKPALNGRHRGLICLGRPAWLRKDPRVLNLSAEDDRYPPQSLPYLQL